MPLDDSTDDDECGAGGGGVRDPITGGSGLSGCGGGSGVTGSVSGVNHGNSDCENEHYHHHGIMITSCSNHIQGNSGTGVVTSVTTSGDEQPNVDNPSIASTPLVKHCLRKAIKHLCSNIGLFCVIVVYVIFGAFLFEFLESDYELKQRHFIQNSREECLKELWVITERLNVLYERNWTRLVHEQLRKFETSIIAATKIEGFNSEDLLETERHWSFTGSLLYSVTIITTIGYGNLAPKTPEGKIVTMLYALIGVPLMLVGLSSLGALLADTFQFIYSFLCCVPCTKHYKLSRRKSQEYPNEKGYVYQYHKAPTGPSPKHYHQHRRKSREAVGGHFHEELRQIATFPRRTMLATVNTCGRPKLQSRALSTELHQMSGEAHHLLAECTDCSSTPVHLASRRSTIPTPPRPPLVITSTTLSTTETDDGEDMDDNQGTMYTSHDTPSRIPLIWRPPDGGETSTRNVHTSTTLKNRKTPNNQETQFQVPIILVLIILVAYICAGAFIFASWENWTFLDGAYFCFTTLSTIGFGDIVPGKSFRTDTESGQFHLIACCTYLLVGLVLIAMSFSLVQEEIIRRCRRTAIALGFVKQH